jgi:uncharacterized protein YjbI with pentapeptide repeats
MSTAKTFFYTKEGNNRTWGFRFMNKWGAIALLTMMAATTVSPVQAFDAEDLENVRSGQDCRDCDLSGANLQGFNLTGLDLTGSDLFGARLSSANLGGVNLLGADLRRADLFNANTNGTIFRGALFCQTVMPDGNLRNDNC